MVKISLLVTAAAVCAVACLPATREAGLRRMAESQVENCMLSTRCQRPAIVACYRAAEQWCRINSMEKSCGEGGSPGVCTP